eukprot:COSAG02_NODE_17840_length_976_cov_3.265678_1_plen_308_part_00
MQSTEYSCILSGHLPGLTLLPGVDLPPLRMFAAITALLLHSALPDTVWGDQVVSGDVVVYGATAAGCVAAIAASRSGARSVIVANPYNHVGGMTTGGLMHADGGNSTVIHGITREYFERVMSHYPAPPPPHPAHDSSYSFACRANRCIEQNDVPGNKTTCDSACAPLAQHEWLAVTFLSKLSDDNRTLTVSLPAGQKTSFIKKSEKLAKDLPKSSVRVIKDGQVLHLARPAVLVDHTYFLIELAEIESTVANEVSVWHSLLPPEPVPGGPGCEDPSHPHCWMYESHVAEQVLEERLCIHSGSMSGEG